MWRATVKRLLLFIGIGALVAVLPAEIGVGGSLKSWLYMLGGSYECLGVGLVAAPELFPLLRRGVNWSHRKFVFFRRHVATWLQKIFHRPVRSVIGTVVDTAVEHDDAATVGVRIAGALPPNTTVEEKIAYLLGQVEAHEDRLGALEGQTESIDSALREELQRTRAALDRLARERIEASEQRHLEWRYAGLGLLFVGLALSTAGNLV